MKKILFLLLLSVAMYGQVPADATPLENIQITNNVEDNASTKVTVQNANGVQNWKFATSLPVSTATANALDLKVENSSGAIEGFAITNNGDGTVNIATGTAYLRTTNNPYAPLIKYVIPAVTNLALMDNANNFVLVDYNGGSPALTVTIAPGTINTTTNSIAYLISRVGNTLDYINLVGQNVDANGKLRRRFLNSESLRRASGVVLTASNRNLLLTAGLFYSGLIEATTPAFNTSTGSTFTQAYLNGSTWVRSTGNTQINNTQYSLAGVLTTMPTNDYRVDYVYTLADNPSKLYVLLGTTTYNNITNARLAPVPVDLPTELQYLGARVGRVIIQKNATTTETTSEFATIYQAGTAQLHNDLGGLNAGDFQHLTVAEKANIVTTIGVQTITGKKTFTNSSSGSQILLNNTSSGVGIFSDNYVGGIGILSNNNLAGIGISSDNFANGIGIYSNNRSTGNAIVANSQLSATGFNYIGQNNGINTFTVDKLGVTTATSFVNSSAPATNALLANGSTLANPISGTGTTGYLPKFTSAGVLGNSIIFDNGNNIRVSGEGKYVTNDFVQGSVGTAITIGADQTGEFGRILVGKMGDSVSSNLIFQEFGGNVGIGTTNPTAKLDVNGSASISSLAGTGTRTVVASSTGQLSAVSNIDYRNYKVYTALLTQTGTNAPVATVLENTLGGSVVWTRSGTGSYAGTLTGVFTDLKTWTTIGGNYNSPSSFLRLKRNTLNDVSLVTESGGISDNVLENTSVEIRVYN